MAFSSSAILTGSQFSFHELGRSLIPLSALLGCVAATAGCHAHERSRPPAPPCAVGNDWCPFRVGEDVKLRLVNPHVESLSRSHSCISIWGEVQRR